MKTCATCLCWHKTGHSPVPRRIVSDTGVRVIEPGLEGQCHRSSPVEDFRWPLTSAGDWCAEHRTEPTMTTLESTDQIVRALDCSLRPALTPETIKILETGTPGAASPAAAPCEAGTEQGPAADDTGNRRPKRTRTAPKA